jgi:hypothetical protein
MRIHGQRLSGTDHKQGRFPCRTRLVCFEEILCGSLLTPQLVVPPQLIVLDLGLERLVHCFG